MHLNKCQEQMSILLIDFLRTNMDGEKLSCFPGAGPQMLGLCQTGKKEIRLRQSNPVQTGTDIC